MIIVLEGPDATGKSTLADVIARYTGYRVCPSEGPEKYEGEINDRVRRYMNNSSENTVFDRHPCVSQPIYAPHRNGEAVTRNLIELFYGLNPFFIYCRPTDLVVEHLIKEHDTPQHIEMLKLRGADIAKAYDEWALDHANFIYRIGDSHMAILHAIGGLK